MARNPLIAGIIFFFCTLISQRAISAEGIFPPRAMLVQYVANHYPEQLTNPQKKVRKTLSQFGYNLSYFRIPTFPITSFINPNDFGIHSYSKPGRKEKNGCLYTCRGGFIDFSHLRAGLDWTVYLAFTILNDPASLELPPEAGSLRVSFNHLDELSIPDIADLAQKIAFERLTWHEVASWHYHPPYHIRKDDQSAFTPEDTYSNFLGTEIGKNIVLRILSNMNCGPFETIATEEIKKAVSALLPVQTKKESKQAYDLVDRFKQLNLPECKRNTDVWWDSKIVFQDQRYIFKRDINIGPSIDPWLVPSTDVRECDHGVSPEILEVPCMTNGGHSFYDYYTFNITPDTAMFYGRRGQLIHLVFPPFETKNFGQVMAVIAREMEGILCNGFDRRDCCDPVNDYTRLRRVGLYGLSGHQGH